jgi:hypothetical protein
MKKYKIRIEYDCQPETKGAVMAKSREAARKVVTPNPAYKVTKIFCEEIPLNQACLFSDDWDERIEKWKMENETHVNYLVSLDMLHAQALNDLQRAWGSTSVNRVFARLLEEAVQRLPKLR